MKSERIGSLIFNDGVPKHSGVYITFDGVSYWLNKYDSITEVWHYGIGSLVCRKVVFGDVPLDSEELGRYEKSARRSKAVYQGYYPKWSNIGWADDVDLFDIQEEE